MKWLKKIHKDEDRRIKSGFLFLPKCLMKEDGSFLDCRWWEYATWEQKYYVDWDGFGQWFSFRWVEKENETL